MPCQYFLYRHKRKSDGQVFYVGIGKTNLRGLSHKTVYRRAYDERNRNRYWISEVSKHGFTAEIFIESDDRDFIQQKEIELILKYGRRDLGLGNLVNLTDGGDNCLNKSKESIRKQIETSKKNGSYEKSIERLSKYKNNKTGIDSARRKDCFLYDRYGWFISWFPLLKETSVYAGTHGSYLSKYTDTFVSVKGFFVFSKFMGQKIIGHNLILRTNSDAARKNVKKRKIEVFYQDTGIKESFCSIIDFCRKINVSKHTIRSRIKRGVMHYKNIKIISIGDKISHI